MPSHSRLPPALLQFADVADLLVSFKIPEELTLRAAGRRAKEARWRLEQDLIRKMPGVLSTRVGYSGGDVLTRLIATTARMRKRLRSCLTRIS